MSEPRDSSDEDRGLIPQRIGLGPLELLEPVTHDTQRALLTGVGRPIAMRVDYGAWGEQAHLWAGVQRGLLEGGPCSGTGLAGVRRRQGSECGFVARPIAAGHMLSECLRPAKWSIRDVAPLLIASLELLLQPHCADLRAAYQLEELQCLRLSLRGQVTCDPQIAAPRPGNAVGPGPFRLMAPELALGFQRSEATTSYVIGALASVLTEARLPFVLKGPTPWPTEGNILGLLEAITRGKRLPIRAGGDSDVAELLSAAVQIDRAARPTPVNLLSALNDRYPKNPGTERHLRSLIDTLLPRPDAAFWRAAFRGGLRTGSEEFQPATVPDDAGFVARGLRYSMVT